MKRLPIWCLTCITVLACKAEPVRSPTQPTVIQAKAPPSVPVLVSEPRIQELPSGARKPMVVDVPIRANRLLSAVVEDYEISEVALPAEWQSPAAAESPVTHVSVEGEAEAPFSFVVPGGAVSLARSAVNLNADALWIRREKAQAGQPLRVHLFTAASDVEAGYAYTVEVGAGVTSPEAQPKPEKVLNLFLQALASFAAPQSTKFRFYATAARLFTSAAGGRAKSTRSANGLGDTRLSSDWQELMSLTSGLTSVEGALQRSSGLANANQQEPATVPLSLLSPPRLTQHPWPQMLKLLKQPVPDEPLAKATPAEFYYLRAKGLSALFQLLDEADAWITPALGLIENRMEDRGLALRYQTLLGLKRTPLSQLLGPALVEQVALVGSDPFIPLGSDVTLLFQVKNSAAFALALAKNLEELTATHGKASVSSSDHAGSEITLSETADQHVRRFSAVSGHTFIISTSRAALERVLDTLGGTHRSLANESDFRYMLARDRGVPEDILAYAGDRFLTAIVSPEARILDARRKLARSELLGVSYAALAHAWAFGKLPDSAATLQKRLLLDRKMLFHFDGGPITFDSQNGPSSKWGSPSALTSLIDLEAPKKVSAAEQLAYQDFVHSYESLWSDAIDPIALRIKINESPSLHSLSARLRILPLIADRQYREIAELVGDVRLTAPKLEHGLRMLFSIAKDSSLRRELDGSSRSFLGKSLSLNWVGDWAFVGLNDQASVANALLPHMRPALRPGSEPPRELESALKLPLFAGIGIKSPTLAALAFAAARNKLTDFGSGLVQLLPEQKYRGLSILTVKGPDAVTVYAALSQHAFYVSLDLPTLESLLEDDLSGKLPQTLARRPDATHQFFVDLSGRHNGGLVTSLMWGLEQMADEAPDSSRARAQALLLALGAADASEQRRIAESYLGGVPLTRDGRQFELTASGVGEEMRGTEHSPNWPVLPVLNSPIERILAGFRAMRSSISFDAEPSPNPERQERSLAIELEVSRNVNSPGATP